MNKADRDLFFLGLERGDLVQLHSDNIEENKPSSAKVIVGTGFMKDDSPNWMSTSWYCGGSTCVVHEKFLYPINWVYDPNNITSTDHTLYSMGILRQTGSTGAK